ncbi:hypothetical protein Glove_169g41 [Diversispora epigaea]|uniref:Cytochrome P450 n=1 Tax=Diversispora epigaea TaxID=1348612 RepID=A0A397IVQ1_9GLOM|nr:hypothetical protein Glove_169g41 [Diversispora epigaea]
MQFLHITFDKIAVISQYNFSSQKMEFLHTTFDNIYKIAIISLMAYASCIVLRSVKNVFFGPLAKVPGPKLLALSNAFMLYRLIRKQRHVLWKYVQLQLVPKYGKLIRVGPNKIICSDKDEIKRILVTENLPKGQIYENFCADKITRKTLGSTVDVESGKKMRRLFSYGFSTKYLSSLEPLIKNCIRDLVTKIEEDMMEQGVVVNIVDLIRYTVLDIVGDNIFGKSFKSFSSEYNSSFDIFELVQVEMRRMILYMMGLINERRKLDTKRNDLLDIVINLTEDKENAMNDVKVRDQCLEFLVAGTETTSFTITLALILLAKHPEKMQKVIKEFEDAFVDLESDDLPTLDELKKLPYLNAVIMESMRIFPPLIGPVKETIEDMMICGYFIPKGTAITCNTYATHHSKEYWGDDVEEFKPERWLEPEKLPKDAFLPFSAGSRNCIGMNHAWNTMRLILGTLIHRYNFEDIPNQKLEFINIFLIKLENGEYKLKATKKK